MVKLGSKRQGVIPKLFRESYKLKPMQEVTRVAEKEGVLVKQAQRNITEELRKLAEKAAKKRNGKPFVYRKEDVYEQYEKRAESKT